MKRKDTWEYIDLWEKRHGIERITNSFQDQFNRILALGKDIDSEELHLDDYNPETGVRSIYLGSILSITPSGKFYTPFANSNVSLKEAALDELWWDYMGRGLGESCLSLVLGEGDGLDLFLVRYYDILDYEDKDEDEYKIKFRG